MAKIAVELERALTLRRDEGTPGQTMPLVLAQGNGWAVADVLCTSGPQIGDSKSCTPSTRFQSYWPAVSSTAVPLDTE